MPTRLTRLSSAPMPTCPTMPTIRTILNTIMVSYVLPTMPTMPTMPSAYCTYCTYCTYSAHRVGRPRSGQSLAAAARQLLRGRWQKMDASRACMHASPSHAHVSLARRVVCVAELARLRAHPHPQESELAHTRKRRGHGNIYKSLYTKGII